MVHYILPYSSNDLVKCRQSESNWDSGISDYWIQEYSGRRVEVQSATILGEAEMFYESP